ncbi:MAG: M15 family metallopeptidase [Acidimicrobiales bacterium]|nr:M15 family metallopeptidase [Acidimicrobiales bacterium]RZV43531.1 MAG: M15 family peptidase [Acidimicrobiales bacterium]
MAEAAPTTTAAAIGTTVSEARPSGNPRPEWFGTRLLPLRADENGVAQPTPNELTDRQLWTTDTVPPPIDDSFRSEIIIPVPDEVLLRSTWTEDCPVGSDELAYAQLTFRGFDGLAHTGELLTNREWVDELIDIFRQLYEWDYPIEEMRITTQADLDAHPTGDGNNTGSFGCRPAVGSTNWSRHAFGLAIDINPFHNPYVRGDLILPELAESYLDRDQARVGMLNARIVTLFDDIGWGWGGRWTNSSDWMHFSQDGR